MVATNVLLGKHAVVTGGTSGIGRASSIALSASGSKVIATGLTEKEVDAALSDPAFSGIEAFALDVSNSGAVEQFFSQLDRLDILVNAAGIGRGTTEFEQEGFLKTIDVNLAGTMRSCYSAKPLLARNGGAIVNIASVMSFFGTPTAPAYAASKGGVMQLTKSLALAWADDDIRVNAVAPGWIDTPMTKTMQADQERNGKVLARSPMKRWGKPEEVAAGIWFLCSPMASFVTGVVLPVDGGYLVSGI